MSDTLKQFWSNINNVENANSTDIQRDILAYLEQIERYKQALEEIHALYDSCGAFEFTDETIEIVERALGYHD